MAKNEQNAGEVRSKKEEVRSKKKNNKKSFSNSASANPTPDFSFVEKVLEILNKGGGLSKGFSANTKNTQQRIKARCAEGYQLDDFRAVIELKVSEWGSDPKMKKYLRPETLFGSKFESYLVEAKRGDSDKKFMSDFLAMKEKKDAELTAKFLAEDAEWRAKNGGQT